MDRSIESLDPKFKYLAMKLIADCRAAGVDVMIINTRRTAAEQLENLNKGVSWVTHSKHQDGLAIDLAPLTGTKINWAADNPQWLTMGEVGEKLGLVWGGRWKERDMGHFEYKEPPKPLEVA